MVTPQWYRWTVANTATAQAALDYINGNQNLPLTGKNAKTGLDEPTKQKTTLWAESLTTCTDGMVGFPRLPEQILNNLGITPEDRQLFLDTFNPSIDDYDPSWIPTEEE